MKNNKAILIGGLVSVGLILYFYSKKKSETTPINTLRFNTDPNISLEQEHKKGLKSMRERLGYKD